MRSKAALFVGWGFLLWLMATIFFRLLGQFLLNPGNTGLIALTFLATIPLIAAVTYPIYVATRVEPHERPTAALCIVLPGMLLDAISLSFSGVTFPNLSEVAAEALFGAWILWAYSLILLSGLHRAMLAGRRTSL